MAVNDLFDTFKKELLELQSIELILLKGHLLLEICLNELLKVYVRDWKSFDKLGLMFSKKLALYQALVGNRSWPCGYGDCLSEINRIRNKLAHKIDFDDYHVDLKKWACKLLGYTPKTINRKRTYRNTLVKAFGLLSGLLSGAAQAGQALKRT